MNKLTPDQQAMLAAWQQHTYAEFVLKDADAALATMTENPYVFMISSGTVRVGRAAVHEFYANHFLPKIPPDLEITSLSQTFGNDRIVEEMVMRFTHTIDMDWILPGVRPTGRRAEFVLAGIIHLSRWQDSPRASLLGSGDAAFPDGRPRSSVGGGRSWKCGATSETR